MRLNKHGVYVCVREIFFNAHEQLFLYWTIGSYWFCDNTAAHAGACVHRAQLVIINKKVS